MLRMNPDRISATFLNNTHMKKSFYIFFLLGLFSASAIAQNSQKTIIDELNSSKWGQGDVKVMQDDVLQGKIAVRSTEPIDSLGEPEPSYIFECECSSRNQSKRVQDSSFYGK
jgi:hypothetical protein